MLSYASYGSYIFDGQGDSYEGGDTDTNHGDGLLGKFRAQDLL